MDEPKPQPRPTPEDVRDKPPKPPMPITDEQMWEYYRQNGRVK